MWLLNSLSHELKYFEGQAPPYAILSHRWQDDEVTFQEVLENRHIARKGWAKIQACCEKAASEGYAYIWADTCCIDKKSSAELSEAINSMFRWYREAKVCYAFLCDVSHAANPTDSLWFTRGWTLQELLAPSRVLFFDRDWKFIGSKHDLCASISKSTRIPEEYITKFRPGIADYYSCGIAQIMSWAARRRTTRTEDRAYSLMGLFDINMPLLYGEGPNAFLRLQHEIAKSSNDLSIFAWEGASSRSSGMFANSPGAFADCQNYVPYYHYYTITKHALVIVTPTIYTFPEPNCFALCITNVDTGTERLRGCILIVRDHSGSKTVKRFFRYRRGHKNMVFIPLASEAFQPLELDEIEITSLPTMAGRYDMMV